LVNNVTLAHARIHMWTSTLQTLGLYKMRARMPYLSYTGRRTAVAGDKLCGMRGGRRGYERVISSTACDFLLRQLDKEFAIVPRAQAGVGLSEVAR
jgi:hypothetical protein